MRHRVASCLSLLHCPSQVHRRAQHLSQRPPGLLACSSFRMTRATHFRVILIPSSPSGQQVEVYPQLDPSPEGVCVCVSVCLADVFTVYLFCHPVEITKGQIHKVITWLLRQKFSVNSTKNSTSYFQSGYKYEKRRKMCRVVGIGRAAPD